MKHNSGLKSTRTTKLEFGQQIGKREFTRKGSTDLYTKLQAQALVKRMQKETWYQAVTRRASKYHKGADRALYQAFF